MDKLIKEYQELSKDIEILFKKGESKKHITSKLKKIREKIQEQEIEDRYINFKPIDYV